MVQPVTPERSVALQGLSNRLSFHVRLAQTAIARDFEQAVASTQLTQLQCTVMELVGANPGISQGEFASIIGTDRATLMALVDRLELRGFIERRRSKSDRRRQELYVTNDGAVTMRELQKLIREHERRFTNAFSEAELKTLIRALGRIHRAL